MVILIISEEICANNCKIHEKGVHNREIRVQISNSQINPLSEHDAYMRPNRTNQHANIHISKHTRTLLMILYHHLLCTKGIYQHQGFRSKIFIFRDIWFLCFVFFFFRKKIGRIYASCSGDTLPQNHFYVFCHALVIQILWWYAYVQSFCFQLL